MGYVPQKSSKIKKVSCLKCNSEFLRYPTKKRPVPMFCSRKCANSSPLQIKKKEGKYWMQQGIKGETSPNWKGGISRDREYLRFLWQRHTVRKRYGNRGAHVYEEWKDLLKKCGNKCVGCGVSSRKRMVVEDHIIPLSKGGSDRIENIQPLCQPCNRYKWVDTKSFIKKFNLNKI